MSKATILAILAGLCWGIGELFTKSVLTTGRVGPITTLAVRTTVAMPFFWCMYVLATNGLGAEPRGWTQAGTATLLKLVLGSAFLTSVVGTLCFVSALRLGEVSRVKPIAFALAPATAVIFGPAVFHEPLTAKKIAAVVLILIGVALLAGD